MSGAGPDRGGGSVGSFLFVAFVLGASVGMGMMAQGIGDQFHDSSPEATFDAELAGEDVRITHEGGESIPTDQLTVRVGDREYDAGAFVTADVIGEGTNLTVPAGADERVSLVWEDGGSDAVVYETELGDR